jgi:hypothetical protein
MIRRASADWMTMENARSLADKIEKYWLAAGYAGIKCWAERQQVSGQIDGSICIVRSNMICGFPPRMAG